MSLNLEAVEAAITNEQFFVFPGTTMTVCCLTLHTGCGHVSVVGHGDCINPEDFDLEKGQAAARRRAVDEAFGVLGTHLKLGGQL